jgi:hypothetical protein
MATYTAVGGIGITYTFKDAKGSTTTTTCTAPSGITLANIKLYADALGDALAAASDAELIRYNVSVAYDASGAPASVAGGRVEDKGLFAAQTAAGKNSFFTIPAIKLSTLLANEYDIDLADALITAVTNLLITGDGTTAPVDTNASDLASVVNGRLQQRRGISRN